MIEAATEREDLKIKILKDLCATLSPRAIVATNTSSISITKLAAATDRPDRFIGMTAIAPQDPGAFLNTLVHVPGGEDVARHSKILVNPAY